MSDGAPNQEDWRTPLAELTDHSFHLRPYIVSFGVSGAEASVINEISTPQFFAFLAEAGVSPGAALREIMKFLVNS
jgi:hypothetical protein